MGGRRGESGRSCEPKPLATSLAEATKREMRLTAPKTLRPGSPSSQHQAQAA